MLASPAEIQVAFLRRLGTYPLIDELALEFDDEYARVRAPLGPDSEALAPGTSAALAALDAKLGSMSGPANAHLWRPPALNGPDWAKVRDLAHLALTELGSSLE